MPFLFFSKTIRLPSLRGLAITAFVFAFFLLTGAHAQAANHYVRQGASGNGSDWANAYGSLPAALTRGDTYYIADGSYGDYTFDDPAIGTSMITVKKATVADHGNSTGWYDSYGNGQAVFGGKIEFTSSYWIFDGVTGGGAGSWGSGYGFKIVETSDQNANIRINYSGTANNITIRHVDLLGKGSVSTQGGYYSNDAVAIYSSANNITLSYIWTHGTGRAPIFIPSGQNAVFEYFYIENFYGSSGVHSTMMSTGQGYMGDITFRYSLVTDIQSTGGIMWDNHSNHNAHIYVYGNVFYRPIDRIWGNGNGVIGGWAGGNSEDCYGMRIYNNTFININIDRVFTDFMYRSGDNIASNNLFYNCTSPAYSNIQTHNFNHYINSGGVHSEANGTSAASGDPFVNMTGLDFRLKSATIGGQSLSNPFNNDANGTIRGADGVWDRGAYEYGGTPSTCTPNWTCTAWSACQNSTQTRTCTDSNNCNTASGRPALSQTCSVDGNLILNGDFEQGFTSGLANSWNLAKDGTINSTLSQDAGYQGLAQKIGITTPGSWGLFFYQTPAFVLNQDYEWSFWYKAGNNGLWAEITDSQANNSILQTQLPSTNGQWQYKTLYFKYTNSNATQLRYSADSLGSYWIDQATLKTGSQPAKKGDLNADAKVDVTDLGIFLANWGMTTKPASDLNQDGKVDVTDLGILLGNWGWL